jgi:ATP-dependent DNA helicase UvrD/PcrA
MDTFEERYSKLNPEQKEAVDTIDGPLLVVAGPGTGKTEILSLRVANILRQKAIAPKNILCLTFTVSATYNMRERLSELIGPDAYKVAIHTFHSFGVDIISSHPEYFYEGTTFSAVDDLTQIEILENILSELPHGNDLSNLHPEGGYAYLDDIKSTISDLKKAGITPRDFRTIIEYNKKSLEFVNPAIDSVFSPRVSMKAVGAIEDCVNSLSALGGEESPFSNISSIIETVQDSLTGVLSDVEVSAKSTPISEWKSKMTKKDGEGTLLLKDTLYLEKLFSLADIYEEYQNRMYTLRYFDYDDMILKAIEGIRGNLTLKHELLDKYEYILVDEFQDTNNAQMKLLNQITGKGIAEANPNVMAVGDDDQAIFKFQGAELSNILSFTKTYPDTKIVTITSNYRSTQNILDVARYVITQGFERLENKFPELDKSIVSKVDKTNLGELSCKSFTSCLHEYYWVCNKVKELISKDKNPSAIAIIGRNHSQLKEIELLMNYFKVPIKYERNNNVFHEPHIRQLIQITRFISTLSRKHIEEADNLLPEILSYPFWGLNRKTIWDISKTAHRSGDQNKTWLEVMQTHENDKVRSISDFFIDLAATSSHESLENVLDIVIGASSDQVPETEEDDEQITPDNGKNRFLSPFKEFYFRKEKLNENPLEYLRFLSSLRVFIQKIREYKKDQVLRTEDLLTFVELHEKNNIPIIDNSPFLNAENAVSLLTAHKSKGLEFDTVFVINCQEDVWAGKNRGSMLPMPVNLPITPAGDTTDDQLRLFYVAITRAKRNLFLTLYEYRDNGRKASLLPFIVKPAAEDIYRSDLGKALTIERHQNSGDPIYEATDMLSASWESYHAPPIAQDEKIILKSLIEHYQLSVTHLNNFLDVTRGGPHLFFHQNLLRFPQSKSSPGSFGSAVHRTMEFIYTHLKKTGETPGLEQVLIWFDRELQLERLNKREFNKYSGKGRDVLTLFYDKKIENFHKSHISEFNFKHQGVVLKGAHLSGKIDKMVPLGGSEFIVHDFKTGKAKPDWKGRDNNEKTLLHNYRRQLVFYKILVENSKDFGDTYRVNRGVLEFVEPKGEELIDLEAEITKEEVNRTQELLQIVYSKIRALEFPNTGSYKNNLSGIVAFEDDLLDGKL